MRKAKAAFVTAMAAVALFAGGCASERWWGWTKSRSASRSRRAEGPLIALLPMRAGARLPLYGTRAICHLTGEHFEPGPVSEQAVREVSRRLWAKLSGVGLEVVPESAMAEWVARTDPNFLYRYEKSLGASAALSTGAEFGLMGVLVRYEERSGTWWASAFPASVVFTLVVVEAGTGRTVWSYRFDEAQVPFWRRREPAEMSQRFRSQEPLATSLYPLPWWDNLRWITRRELADRGLGLAASSLSTFLRRARTPMSSQTSAGGATRACAPSGRAERRGGHSCVRRSEPLGFRWGSLRCGWAAA